MIDPKSAYELMQAYFDGDASSETVESIEAWLKQDPANIRVFAEYGCIEDMLYAEQQVIDSDAIYGVIAKGSADPIWIAQIEKDLKTDLAENATDKDAITFREIAQLTGFLLGEVLTSKFAYKAYAYAAVVLLAVTMFFVFSGDDTPTDQLADQSQNITTPTIPPVESTPAVVATLTAEHDALWHRRPGQDLYAGQRFKLTQGFAEITTNRGAIAIIEAPATFELLDNDNALHLHTGRLVGICETESSKGFLVRTPHMDITDLGTRFGVDASSSDATEVHVFEGEVQAARLDAAIGTAPTTLVAKQSARASAHSDTISRIDYDALAFVNLEPQTITLPGTGVGLSVGDTDPNWRIIAIDGVALPEPVAATVADPAGIQTTRRKGVSFMPNERNRSQWITWTNYIEATRSLTYQTTFEADALDLDSLVLELRLIADNDVAAIQLNGRPVDVSTLRSTAPDFTEMQTLAIDRGLVAGQNTLTIVTDRYRGNPAVTYWTGLRAELQLTGRRFGAGPSE